MKLVGFCVKNYRNVVDSGWIKVHDIGAIVGQNECGKSNLLQALYALSPFDDTKYSITADWPIDRWPPGDPSTEVCTGKFELSPEEDEALYRECLLPAPTAEGEPTPDQQAAEPTPPPPTIPRPFTTDVTRTFNNQYTLTIPSECSAVLDLEKAGGWILSRLPKCVYMSDYATFAGHTEVVDLVQRMRDHGRKNLDEDDKTILITLELAGLKLDDLVGKAGTEEGRTLRGFDTNAASAYLTKRFTHMWKQKAVEFNIRVDGPTLDIHVEDEGLGAFVPLARRSTGFQWFVSFIWRFTHASRGDFKDCILLLDEPGIHLHHAGHTDLLTFLQELSRTNTVLYTTHLATLIDPAYPERIRVMEVHDHHGEVKNSMISSQRQPMMVIEAVLGLSGGMSGLLGNRQNLIVEGGEDAIIIHKLSGLLANSGDERLSDRVFMIPADGASKTPMYAAFMIGNGFDAAVLLDSDDAGFEARKKIKENYLDGLAAENQAKFRILMLGDIPGFSESSAAIEDLFPVGFYLDCANEAYGTNLTESDLPTDGSQLIANRVERALISRGRTNKLDKRRIMGPMQDRFNAMNTKEDMPAGTYEKARALVSRINAAFT